MKRLLLIFALAASAHAQVSVPIPAGPVTIPAATATSQGVIQPDNATLTVKAGVASCSLGYDTTSTHLLLNGVPITSLTLNTLTLTGGTTYPAGKYLVSIDGSNNLTYTPYTPSAGIAYSVPVPPIAAYGVWQGLVPNLTTFASGQVAFVYPVLTAAPSGSQGFQITQVYPLSNGTVYLRVENRGSQSSVATNYYVTVK